jgi:hypothetical protein
MRPLVGVAFLRHAAVASLLAVAACGDSGDTTSSGGTGATGAGGQSTQGGAGAGGAGGGGGAGGATAPSCSPYDADSCDAGQTCTVADEALGLDGGTICTDAGDNPIGAACTQPTDCVAGAHCDRVTGTCKAFCEGLTDCDGADCLAATSQAGLEIPGIKVCLIHCNPQTAEGCDSSAGDVSCVFRPDVDTVDCFIAGDGQINAPCELDADCDVGLGCISPGQGSFCQPWCTDGAGNVCEHPDAFFAICVPRAPAVVVDDVEYGGCVPGT